MPELYDVYILPPLTTAVIIELSTFDAIELQFNDSWNTTSFVSEYVHGVSNSIVSFICKSVLILVLEPDVNVTILLS